MLERLNEEIRCRTRVTELRGTAHEPERVFVDPTATAGVQFEFVEPGSTEA